MKLSTLQLEAHVKKNLASIYIVSGEDIVLKQEALTLIRKTAKSAGFNERIRFAPDSANDWDELYILLYTNSLLAEKRLLEFNFCDHTPNKAASKLLQEYGEKPAPDTILLINANKIDDKISKSEWYKSLEKNGVLVAIWPLPREQLPAWITNRAKKYKLTIERQAADLLADYVEGNLVAASHAIEKIYLLQPDKAIDIELVNLVLTDESRFTIFEFIENVIAGNKARALHMLDNLKNDGTEPVIILWGITRELRILADMAQQLLQGLTYDVLFQKNRIFAKRQLAMRQFLKKHTKENCWHYLAEAAELDKIAKGAVPGNIWDALQLFCLRVV